MPRWENSVHDHRVDELVATVGQILGLATRLQKESAAAGETELAARVSSSMKNLAEWWDKFATTEVGRYRELFRPRSLGSRQPTWPTSSKNGTPRELQPGDVAFWRAHVDRFRSPKAYALVVDSLLEPTRPRGRHEPVDPVAQPGRRDFARRTGVFFSRVGQRVDGRTAGRRRRHGGNGCRRARRTRHPPLVIGPQIVRLHGSQRRAILARSNLGTRGRPTRKNVDSPASEVDQEAIEEEEDPSDGLYAAAYEDVVFRDSANDGFEGEMLQGGQPETDLRVHQRGRPARRSPSTSSAPWPDCGRWPPPPWAPCPASTATATTCWPAGSARPLPTRASFPNYCRPSIAIAFRRPRGSHDSMVEFDHRRTIKEHLLEQIIATCVETADASRSIRAAMEGNDAATHPQGWEEPAQRVLRAVFRGEAKGARAAMPDLLAALAQQPLLYVALARGGSPLQIVASRSIQRVLRRLLAYLPRLGLLEETFRLIGTIHDMERNHAVGPGAITEFDQMFEIGCKGIAQCLTFSSETWHGQRPLAPALEDATDIDLIAYLERTVESLLQCWLDHSRRVRLSVLETVTEESRWRALRKFIEQYGHDLFTQKFMNLGNLRAILHQGVDAYLRYLEEEPEEEGELRLVADLKGPLNREEAIHWLELILEAIVENYSEYIDYNSTTTQSDRGEMLYTLLDFLRLQASYNRVAWNLRPVILAHEVLVRAGRDYAAEIWRQAVVERTSDIAREHLKRFQQLARQYGMRLPSVARATGRGVRSAVDNRPPQSPHRARHRRAASRRRNALLRGAEGSHRRTDRRTRRCRLRSAPLARIVGRRDGRDPIRLDRRRTARRPSSPRPRSPSHHERSTQTDSAHGGSVEWRVNSGQWLDSRTLCLPSNH